MDNILDYKALEGDKIVLHALLDANFSSGSDINDFVKLTPSGSNITVSVDTNGTAGCVGGANWTDVCVLDSYGTPGNELAILIDGEDHHLTVV